MPSSLIHVGNILWQQSQHCLLNTTHLLRKSSVFGIPRRYRVKFHSQAPVVQGHFEIWKQVTTLWGIRKRRPMMMPTLLR